MHLQKRRRWLRWGGRAAGPAAVVLMAAASAQGAGDHDAAQALVLELEHDTAHATVTADAVASAKGALERATRLRSAGDEAHARAADGLALEWAQGGRDVARAVDAEAKAAELRHKAVDAQALLERTRAQIEEGIARVGRLRAQLQEAEKAGKVDHVAVEVHEGEAPPPRKKSGSKKGAASPTPDAEKPVKAGAP